MKAKMKKAANIEELMATASDSEYQWRSSENQQRQQLVERQHQRAIIISH